MRWNAVFHGAFYGGFTGVCAVPAGNLKMFKIGTLKNGTSLQWIPMMLLRENSIRGTQRTPCFHGVFQLAENPVKPREKPRFSTGFFTGFFYGVFHALSLLCCGLSFLADRRSGVPSWGVGRSGHGLRQARPSTSTRKKVRNKEKEL